MKYVKQFGIIMIISFIGEIIHYFVDLPVPASIYGMVIMFVCLCLKIIKPSDVRETSVFLIEVMPLMFIPAGVGLMEKWGVLKPIGIQFLVTCVVSTIIVMGVAGLVTQFVQRMKKEEKVGENKKKTGGETR